MNMSKLTLAHQHMPKTTYETGLCMCPHTLYTCPHTPMYMSSYSIAVLHATDSGGLLEDLKRLPVLENLVREPAA